MPTHVFYHKLSALSSLFFFFSKNIFLF